MTSVFFPSVLAVLPVLTGSSFFDSSSSVPFLKFLFTDVLMFSSASEFAVKNHVKMQRRIKEILIDINRVYRTLTYNQMNN